MESAASPRSPSHKHINLPTILYSIQGGRADQINDFYFVVMVKAKASGLKYLC